MQRIRPLFFLFRLLLLSVVPIALQSFLLLPAAQASLSQQEQEWLQKKGEIIFVSQTLYPPFEFVDSNTNRRGMCIELAQWIATEFGFQAVFKDMAFEDAQQAVLNGEADILTSLFYSKKRDERFDFTDKTWDVPAMIFVKAQRPDISSIQDLTNKRIAMQRGDFAEEFLQSHYIAFQIVPTATFAEAVDKVIAGEADAVIGDEQIVLHHLFSNQLTDKIKAVGSPLYTGQNAMAAKEGSTHLISIMNKGLLLARERGVYESINRKWIGTQYQANDESIRRYLPLLLILLGSALFLILLFLIWNRNLCKAVRRKTDELQRSEEKFRALVETSSDWIWEVDNNLAFTYASPKVSAVLGYSPEEIIGKKIFHTMDEAEAARITPIAEEFIEQKKSFTELHHRNLAKDGREMVFETSGVPFFGINGQLAGYRGISRDISKRHRIEQERQELVLKLQQAQKMETIGLMAGGVAHDLNNILSGVVSYPELLLLQLPEGHEMCHPLQVIQEAGMRAAEVVADLLTVTRGAASTKRIIDCNKLVNEFLTSPEWSKLRLRHPEVECKFSLDPDLLALPCSPVHIRKCLMNLLLNAAEASGAASVISITTKNCYIEHSEAQYNYLAPGEYVILEIVDSGHGIPDHDLERIFEPFYSKKVLGKSGTGLGLTIVWNTVQDHGGTVLVSSSDKGTTFSIVLPATREPPDAQSKEMSVSQLRGQGERILVVDDDQLQREIAGKMLRELGYQVQTVASGEEAIEHVRSQAVDLLLLDMIMTPGIDGYQTYAAIAAMKPGQRAVIASGFAENEAVRQALQLGASRFIKKPYTIRQVGLAVRLALDE